MTSVYLWINAALYAVFAVWCTFNLQGTSHALGYTALSASGHSEYVTVYGGLQWGLALVFAMLAMRQEWHSLGLVVSMLLYAPIVVHRVLSIARFAPVEKMTYGVAALEAGMLVAAVALWFLAQRR